MNNFQSKKFLYLAIGTIVIAAIAGFVPYKQLQSLKSQISDTNAKVQDKSSVKKQLLDVQTELDHDQTQLKHLESNVSSYAYVPSLLLDLDKYGKSCGLNVTCVRPQPPTQTAAAAKNALSKPYDELQIDVSGQGTFGALERFVNGLASFPKIVAAYAITIQPHQDTHATNQIQTKNLLTVTITLNTYIFKSAPPAEANQSTSQTKANSATALTHFDHLILKNKGGYLG